ncbi:MAG: acyl-CoA thioesterase [Pseudomonadota bacterium]
MDSTSPIASKPVSESKIDSHVYRIFPNDLNSHKTVFGGQVMAIADRLALVVAERHSAHICVTASLDSVHFLAPAKEGDTLVFSAAVNKAWNSSMEIGVRVEAENSRTGKHKHIVSAYFTFVALDENNRPVQVPQLILETEDERKRYEAAEIRKQGLLKTRGTMKESGLK